MKGLITKDLFMIKKYFGLYFLMDIVFIVLAFVSPENVMFLMIPALLTGVIPITLLAYDERSRWTEYSGVLPYSRTQIASAKYLVGLILQSVMCVILYILLLLRGAYYDMFDPAGSAVTVLILFAAALVFPAVCLPFCFALGTEKGRIVYMITIAAIVAVLAAISNSGVPEKDLIITKIPPVIWVIIIAVYVLSWLMSAAIYNKKEAGKA